MNERRKFVQKLLCGAFAAVTLPAFGSAFVHPLDKSALPARTPGSGAFLGIARAGNRLVAVGSRGQIVYSDDLGKSWLQGQVPTGVDLVALTFADERTGWAVGHGGAILHTSDGGQSWGLQLDGRKAGELAIEHLRALPTPDTEEARLALDRMIDNEVWMQESGGTQPFMDVFFSDKAVGYVVGTFNRIFRTTDGGQSWASWSDRVDNPQGLHFNAVTGSAGEVYLAGEQGSVWRLSADSSRFELVQTPYIGTLFGLSLIAPGVLLAYGMRGNVFLTTNAGNEWSQVNLPTQAGVTDGILCADGTVVLATQAGTLERSSDNGKTFSTVETKRPMPYYGIVESASGEFVLVGAAGIRAEQVG